MPEGSVVPLADWITIGDLQVRWAFQVDTLSVVMMLVVSGVGTLIHIYAIGYMHEDVRHNGDPRRFRRFFVFMNLFIAMMMILVSGDNYLMLFVGWEGVGLCSYLLIGFWYEKGKDGIGNSLAAKKAMVTNRMGDFGLLLAIFAMFWTFGSLDFHDVFEAAPEVAAAAPARDPVHYAVHVCWRDGQIGPAPAVCLAPGCHGWPYPGFGSDPCRHDGHRRRLSDHPFGGAVCACSAGAELVWQSSGQPPPCLPPPSRSAVRY